MRPSEIMPSDAEDSRCGEIFVSHKADKWTFFCSYCQKGTSDIGVFVCHIRLDHLASLLDFESQKDNLAPKVEDNFPETESQPIDSLSARDGGEYEKDINLIKEETLSQNSYESVPVPTRISKNINISSLTDNTESENALTLKCTSPAISSIEDTEEFLSIRTGDPEQNIFQLNENTHKRNLVKTSDKICESFTEASSDSEPAIKRLNVDQENAGCLNIGNISHQKAAEEAGTCSKEIIQESESNTNKSNLEILSFGNVEDYPKAISMMYQEDEEITRSQYRFGSTDVSAHSKLSLQNQQLEECDDDSSNKSNVSNRASCSKVKDDTAYKCASCELTFVSKRQLIKHLKEIHKDTKSEVRYECKDCCRRVRNISGLKYHLEHVHQISVCQTNLKEYYFMTYIQADEQNHQTITQFQCHYCQHSHEVGSQTALYICTNCGSPANNYKISGDSIPKAQIKTKRPLP